MRSFLTSAALVATASLTLAAPAPQLKPRGTFSVKQVEAGKKLKLGAIDYYKGYQKYAKIGAVAPTHVVNAASDAAQQTGTVQANPEQYDSSYLCPVSVGGQTLTLDFDTGSADLWVFSTLLPSDEQGSHTLYDPSNAQQEQGESWNISYGDGSGAAGVVYADQVVIGGVTATSQAVEAATSVSSEFVQDTDNDGLVGLAFSSINTVSPDQATTFFDTVKDTLESAVFTADLKAGQAGSYDFGYIDSSKYTGEITYVSVDNSQGFWGFTADGYAVGDGPSTSGSIGSSIADTGTSLLYLPTDAVSDYYAQVEGSENSQSDGGYVFPCSASLPDFTVSIGGSDFTVPGSYINYSPASGSNCFGGIQANTGIGLTIFGDIFLKSQFVVFDETQSSPQLGFAAQS